MTARLQIYKCEKCGNIIEVLHEGPGALSCCETEMKLFVENTVDAAKEKHVPVIEKTADGVKIRVGDVAHPMEEKHSIEWIQIVDGDTIQRRFLKPGEDPEASFCTKADKVEAREYCNLHGLWKA
jgi:superoxide reductase